MIQLLQIIFVIVILLSTGLLFYYSMLARRKNIEPLHQLRHRALMNVNMGICFISLASLHLTSSSANTFRYILIGFIYIVGFVNLYYGLKNLKRTKENHSKKTD